MRNLEAIYPRDGRAPGRLARPHHTHTRTPETTANLISNPKPPGLDPPYRGAIVTLRWEKEDGDLNANWNL